MSWTDERIDQLKGMWERGLTASQIADELGGVSRNAVIGKAHRLGLQSRPSPVKANETPKKAAAPAPRKPATAPDVEASRAAAPVVSAPAPIRAPVAAPAAPATPTPAAAAATDAPPPPPQPRIISVGPGGFLRQGPGDQQAPIPPAPPRRLVPAKPSAEIADKTTLLDLT
ncbi:GcrA family cell cycle regulator, partial [Sphingobium sp.]